MKRYTKEELDIILKKHELWLYGELGGERANLRNANLSNANLIDANLRNANLSNANLINANLRNANLIDANLSNANLRNANLRHVTGNNKEIKTVQTGTWIIVYTNNILAVGCQQHSLEGWLNFKTEDIIQMDSAALEFCKLWKPTLKKLGVFNTVINEREENDNN